MEVEIKPQYKTKTLLQNKELTEIYSQDENYLNKKEIKESPYINKLISEEKIDHENNQTTPAKFWKFFYEKDFDSNSMEVVARGNFGEVRKGNFKNGVNSLYSNEIVALKYPLGEKHDYTKEFYSLCHEVSCTFILHPNIVNYIGGLQLDKPRRVGAIMEFVSSNLRNFIEKDNRSSEINNQIKIAKQISSGMNFLHSLNPYILHRDLRSPNILINENLECKIADFGISNNLGYKGIEHKYIYTLLIPPECKNLKIYDLEKFNKKGDIYFFGWILFELFTGKKYEFESEENENNYIQILNEYSNQNNNNENKIENFKELIIKSLEKDPSNRPSFFKLLISFNNLLENQIDYSIISQIEEDLNSIMNKYKINKSDLIEYSDSLGRRLVHEYCIYNNLEGLKQLISIIGKEYLNLVDKYNCTCAHFASRNGNIQILQFLLENGFNKWNEKEKRFNLFPLNLAIAMKHDECIEFLSNYSNIECLNESLVSSSEEGNLEYFRLFLQKGADINFRDNDFSATPLFWSSRNGHLEIVKESINNGANVNQGRTTDGATPLFIASQYGHLEIVKELINNGANLNQARTTDGSAPLFIASQYGYLEIVKELINNGANLNQATINNGSTPLYVACRNGYFSIVKELINKGANVNHAKTDTRVTPLIIACKNEYFSIVKELIENGANVNQRTINNGCTSLIIASQNGYLSIVKELIDNGANVNQASYQNGTTPLFSACYSGHWNIVKELLNHGANVNQEIAYYKFTPLFIASQNGYLEIVKKLIDKKADLDAICVEEYDYLVVNAKDLVVNKFKYSFTPIYIAWWNDKHEIVSILKHKSDINLNIQLAQKNNHQNALKFFETLTNE